jgi:UDP-glucuronate 4-epimerase
MPARREGFTPGEMMVSLGSRFREESEKKRRALTRQPTLVTGAAGFIGYHVAERLLEQGEPVLGCDNLSPYYDVALKEARLDRLRARNGFEFARCDVGDRSAVAGLFEGKPPRRVIHLAAQAGVRHSIKDPHAYADSNLAGFVNVLEGCRHAGVEHLVYASSSSVYGSNARLPFSEHDPADHPLSLYAATKRSNELMAHSYAHLFRLPCSGLRFFTVYGPWGRPDMALFLFTRAIVNGDPIELFNEGRMTRAFTYIDDAVDAVSSVLERPPETDPSWSRERPDPATSSAPHRLVNIGSPDPVDLLRCVALLEEYLGRTAVRRLLPIQPGDVEATAADTSDLEELIGSHPATPLEVGIRRFVEWYRGYYSV